MRTTGKPSKCPCPWPVATSLWYISCFTLVVKVTDSHLPGHVKCHVTSQCSMFQSHFTPLFLLSLVLFLASHSDHYGTQSYTFSFNCPATILTSHVVLYSDTKFSPTLFDVHHSSAVWSNSQVRLPVPTACRGLVDLVILIKSERITPSAQCPSGICFSCGRTLRYRAGDILVLSFFMWRSAGKPYPPLLLKRHTQQWVGMVQPRKSLISFQVRVVPQYKSNCN